MDWTDTGWLDRCRVDWTCVGCLDRCRLDWMVLWLLVRCREAGSHWKKHTYLLSFWSGEILFWSYKNILVMDITFWTQKSQGMFQLVTCINCVVYAGLQVSEYLFQIAFPP